MASKRSGERPLSRFLVSAFGSSMRRPSEPMSYSTLDSSYHVGLISRRVFSTVPDRTSPSRSFIPLMPRQIWFSTCLKVGAVVMTVLFGRVCSHWAVAREAMKVLPVLWAEGRRCACCG